MMLMRRIAYALPHCSIDDLSLPTCAAAPMDATEGEAEDARNDDDMTCDAFKKVVPLVAACLFVLEFAGLSLVTVPSRARRRHRRWKWQRIPESP